MEWKDNGITHAKIVSLSGGSCKVRTTVPVKLQNSTVKSVADANGFVIKFDTQKGKAYVLTGL